MNKNEEGLSRLCTVYSELDEGEKEKIIRLAEGLLTAQEIMSYEETEN